MTDGVKEMGHTGGTEESGDMTMDDLFSVIFSSNKAIKLYG